MDEAKQTQLSVAQLISNMEKEMINSRDKIFAIDSKLNSILYTPSELGPSVQRGNIYSTKEQRPTLRNRLEDILAYISDGNERLKRIISKLEDIQ